MYIKNLTHTESQWLLLQRLGSGQYTVNSAHINYSVSWGVLIQTTMRSVISHTTGSQQWTRLVYHDGGT